MDLVSRMIWLFVAQEGGQGAGTEGGAATSHAPGGGGTQFLIMMLGMIVIFYFLLIRPQMKEQKRRKAMLASIKKHDRVLTNGGLYGTVVSVGDNEVTLKIDENNNVRVKFARSAIASVIRDDTEES